MFCQACGLQNSEGARFCNMCGARIAAAGTPGGAVPAPTQLGVARDGGGNAPVAQPPTGSGLTGVMTPQVANNTTSVSLEAIGVRTAKQTWTMVGAAAVLFAILGVAGTYFTLRHGQPEAGAAAPEDPFTVGAPTVASAGASGEGTPSGAIPEGVAPPEGLPQPSSMANERAEAARPSTHPSATSQAGQGTSAMHETSDPTASSMTSGTDSSMGSSGTMDTATAMGDTAGTDATANGTTADSTATDATGSDPDLEMEMYSGRVRYLVRRYYMASATRCFDHATANNPSLHGQVVVAITIGTNGYVSDASVVRNSTGDDSLGACLAGQARTWRLSPPPGGEAIQMNMPFSR